MRIAFLAMASAVIPATVCAQPLNVPWSGYAHDPQHTAVSATAAQPLNSIHWRASVDLVNAPNPNSPSQNGSLLVHYGSISVTASNTVLVPTRTSNDVYEVIAFNGTACASSLGSTCAPLYTLTSDYSLPASDWTPPYGPALSMGTRLYYPGAGGTVYYRDLVNSATGPNGQPGASGQMVFYGASIYNANKATLNADIQISTPITADHSGNIFFGFMAAAGNGAGPGGTDLVSGIARIGPTGVGKWVSATSLAGNDANVTQVALNCAPALSVAGNIIYVAVSGGATRDTNGDLVSLNATTLAPVASVQLFDPLSGQRATISSDSSAAPMVGSDGDVYYGVLETPCCNSHNDRGWMLHFNSALTTLKTPGSFGWDNTPSLVPASAVPSYSGRSSYLILTKYNNYNGIGTGNGANKVAVLDPNGTMFDEYATSAVTVMSEVITVTLPGGPPVSEWCINTTAIDPFTKAAIINSEDGVVYRWDFTTNTLSQSVVLTQGIGEAYTPTAIGPDGAIFAINDAILFSVGN